MKKNEKKAVVVLSGGLDSATCMGIAEKEGYMLHAITFDYGQRHSREVEQAKKIAAHYQVHDHRIVNIEFFKEIGGSALTDEHIDVPKKMNQDAIPATYVPARNLIFLSCAAAYAEVIKAEAIYTGVSGVDYSGYPDCRPEFIDSLNHTIRLATKRNIEGKKTNIYTPLINLSKADTVTLGLRLHVPYELTTSCYNGEEYACGECDSCTLRLKGFKEAGCKDPIPYKNTQVI
ncbi:7-cyano-7-deazaguanine synthase QueC [Bacillus sonorensis]|uniref:7-cyano-7-deazaguanine synthase n=2 Tax=Bacillus sonorensis TaxID=119858 RepID=M5PFF4_9BACI|nr:MULTISPECIES: 7-cyano-7-deazaguanine synthase QueC [Bacillus]TWK82373.1 7-cyano-7-deazaguanine synthase [Bacillus paralicheniformis]ASB88886.1 7-cyano-7-deazaguanine synthase [Bacillus sonorensis]EME76310.1 exsB protein [Bacillus sonorensis L12]MBG9915330.1 7-cyano-7-deazaguanine synthase [Bacillus sonorensis]MCF7618236.1 7-cyano-7-deazaguanine synthase QueC [Bacillus sonorensis]